MRTPRRPQQTRTGDGRMARHASAALAIRSRVVASFEAARGARDRATRGPFVITDLGTSRADAGRRRALAAELPGWLFQRCDHAAAVLRSPGCRRPPTARTNALQAQRYLARIPRRARRSVRECWGLR